MTEQGEPKDKPLYMDPVKLVPLIGAIIAAILGGIALYDHFSPPATSSVEYVLDTSRGMKGNLGKKHKLKSVKDHILAQVAGIPGDPAALRLAGASGCGGHYKSPSVEFGEDNYDDFESVLKTVRPSGKSNIANAIEQAANDILLRSREASSETANVYVFLGSVDDTCTRNPKASIRAALSHLRAEDVLVDFNFVGVKPSKTTRKLLKAMAEDADELGFTSSVIYANRPNDLEKLRPCDVPAEDEYSGDCS